MMYTLPTGFLVGSNKSQERALEGCAWVLIAVDVGGVGLLLTLTSAGGKPGFPTRSSVCITVSDPRSMGKRMVAFLGLADQCDHGSMCRRRIVPEYRAPVRSKGKQKV